MTPLEARYVRFRGEGMGMTQAARAAGYKHPTDEGWKVEQREHVKAAIVAERAKYEVVADMSRKAVMDGLKDAIEMARLTSDASSMVAGWREIAKILGYYAPETKVLQITGGSGAEAQRQIKNMTDEELVRLIIEGESTRLPDEDDARLLLPETVEAPDDAVQLDEPSD